MTNELGHRPKKPIYLADLFFLFKVHAERLFSAEGTLRRIEEAQSPTSKNVPWEPDENRAKHRHAFEKQQLRIGLAFYLFDRFIHSESDRLDNILVETGPGQFQSVGPAVFTKIGDLDLSRIDHWRDYWLGWQKDVGKFKPRSPMKPRYGAQADQSGVDKRKSSDTEEGKIDTLYYSDRDIQKAIEKGEIDSVSRICVARQRLIEIASQYRTEFPMLDTDLWTVFDIRHRKVPWNIRDEEDFDQLIRVGSELLPYSGLPLWFRGKKPTKKAINDLLGNTTWLNGDYIVELAQQLYEYFCYLDRPKLVTTEDGKLFQKEGDKLFQQDAAKYLGIKKNTRTFMKIWGAFREKLTPEQQAKLPKRGEKKGGGKQPKGSLKRK